MNMYTLVEQDPYLACSPQTDKALLKKLGAALDAMNADGTVKKITGAKLKGFTK